MKEKIFNFCKQYWRETAVLLMFFLLQSQISEANKNAEYAYDSAADARYYARQAWDSADEASNNAQEAADNASYCAYY